MKFFELELAWSEGVQAITVDYLGNPVDPMKVWGMETDKYFLHHFRFELKQSGKRTEVLANNFPWLIVSHRVEEAIVGSGAGSNVVLTEFPSNSCTLRAYEVLKSFKLMSICLIVNCLDLEKSDLTWCVYRGKKHVEIARRIRLKPDGVPSGAHIFTVPELRGRAFVSEAVREKLAAIRSLGCTFGDLEDKPFS